MRKIFIILGAFFLFTSLPVDSYPGTFENIVSFGDDFTDTGNLHATEGVPARPYHDGRFSNGPVWVEYLGEKLGIGGVISNYAYGGAHTGTGSVSGSETGLSAQVTDFSLMNNVLNVTFTKYPESLTPTFSTLFTIWAGANDLLGAETSAEADITGSAANIAGALDELFLAGARSILVFNLPDLSLVPGVSGNETRSADVKARAREFNQALAGVLDEFEAEHPEADLIRFDLHAFIDHLVEAGAEYGFDNVTDSKLTPDGTTRSGTFLFWDNVNFTTELHELIAGKIALFLRLREGLSMGADLRLTIPEARFMDKGYGFTLAYSPLAEAPDKYLWTLDMTTFTENGPWDSGGPVFGPDIELSLSRVVFEGVAYDVTFLFYPSQSDPTGLYWEIDLNSLRVSGNGE